ncbi:MAG: AbrB/MazE/SpoVT family DNA-binding domain-containing protein [Deltaproteobacteria bacterium]|nr:AbrB/MazE/SpoVT family DNA-binding domain-containing protein [Deltaproteobacteria bacterium]
MNNTNNLTTIDKSGRLVLPKNIRDQFFLKEGTILEINAKEEGILMTPQKPKGKFIKKNGIKVLHIEGDLEPGFLENLVNDCRQER